MIVFQTIKNFLLSAYSFLMFAALALVTIGYGAANLLSDAHVELIKVKAELERLKASTAKDIQQKYGFSDKELEYMTAHRKEAAKGLMTFLQLRDKKEQAENFVEVYGSGITPEAMNNIANIINSDFKLHQYAIIPDITGHKCGIKIKKRSWFEPIFHGETITPDRTFFIHEDDLSRNVNGIYSPDLLKESEGEKPGHHLRVKAKFNWLIGHQTGDEKYLHLITEDDLSRGRLECLIGVEITRLN